MKKLNLLIAIPLLLFMLLIFYSCRQETILNENPNSEKQEINLKIGAFERFENKMKTGKSANNNYAYPFAEIILQFFKNHPKYATDFIENVGDIDFRLVSQTIGKEEKMVVFPILKNKKVVAVLFCLVNKEKDFVKFRIVKDKFAEFGSVIDEFQNYYNNRKTQRNVMSREVEIEEVTITKIIGYTIPFSEIYIPNWSWTYYGGSSGGTMDGSGGIHGGMGSGGGGTGNTSPSMTDPCNKIKSNLADSKFSEKVSALNNPIVLNYDHEMGFAVSYPPAGTGITDTQYQPMDNKIGTHSVRLPEGDRFFGFMHTHNNEDGVIKIFSPADIMTFLTSCVENASTNGNIRDAYSMVITSEGSYMLQYTGTKANFGNLAGSLSNWNSQYREDLLKIMNEDGTFTQSNVENTFLQFLKNTVNVNGLELYKVEGTTSKKLSLNSNNITNITPCL